MGKVLGVLLTLGFLALCIYMSVTLVKDIKQKIKAKKNKEVEKHGNHDSNH